MYAAGTEVVDAAGQRVAVTHLSAGRAVLCRKRGKLLRGLVRKVSARVDPLVVTLITAYGRRLTVAGVQGVMGRGKRGVPAWRQARQFIPGDLLYAVGDGILSLDLVVCVVQTEKPGETWVTVFTTEGNIVAEEILCRAS
jgi:hypothetical protein